MNNKQMIGMFKCIREDSITDGRNYTWNEELNNGVARKQVLYSDDSDIITDAEFDMIGDGYSDEVFTYNFDTNLRTISVVTYGYTMDYESFKGKSVKELHDFVKKNIG